MSPPSGREIRNVRWRRDDRGAVVVEFALVMPIMLLLVFGIMDFGYMINRDMLVDNASRDGVRIASLGGSFSQVCDAVKTELDDSGLPAPAACNTAATPTMPTSITLDCVKEDTTSCGATASTFDSLAVSGTTVVLSISYRYSWITPLTSSFMGGDSTVLTQTSQMVVE